MAKLPSEHETRIVRGFKAEEGRLRRDFSYFQEISQAPLPTEASLTSTNSMAYGSVSESDDAHQSK